ncbi:MAG: hypothetical protein AB1505_31270 [Candidatus Latescibacterota bacterium]
MTIRVGAARAPEVVAHAVALRCLSPRAARHAERFERTPICSGEGMW